jgi:hypothetical protein
MEHLNARIMTWRLEAGIVEQVPAEMYKQATIKELPFLCNGEVNTPL